MQEFFLNSYSGMTVTSSAFLCVWGGAGKMLMYKQFCWPYDQHLLLSDFLHQKDHKFLCNLCVGTWVQRLRPGFLITTFSEQSHGHTFSWTLRSAKRLVFFTSDPYHSLAMWSTYTEDQAGEWQEHSRKDSSNWNEGMGCTGLKYHERVEVPTRIPQNKLMERKQWTYSPLLLLGKSMSKTII